MESKTPNTDRAILVDNFTEGQPRIKVAGVDVVPDYVSRREEEQKNELRRRLDQALEAVKQALEALELDAEAIGAAQKASDIDWFKFGQATVMKQVVAMPELRKVLEEENHELGRTNY